MPAEILRLSGVSAPRTRLFGRAAERAAGRALLLEYGVPLSTLTGPGGVGKTRLALAVAADIEVRFADGPAWCDLATLAEELLNRLNGNQQTVLRAAQFPGASIRPSLCQEG